MRFFSGIRTDKKKSLASQRMKDKMMGKVEIPKTQDEIYKERFEARMSKLIEEAQKGQKGGFRIPGTKQDDKPKEMSENAKKMMALLAQKKLEQERKRDRKKLVEMQRAEKAKKKEIAWKKKQEQEAIQYTKSQQEYAEMKLREEQAAAAQNTSWW